jgi:hypothetical protein
LLVDDRGERGSLLAALSRRLVVRQRAHLCVRVCWVVWCGRRLYPSPVRVSKSISAWARVYLFFQF